MEEFMPTKFLMMKKEVPISKLRKMNQGSKKNIETSDDGDTQRLQRNDVIIYKRSIRNKALAK
jgi:hypothetical protein